MSLAPIAAVKYLEASRSLASDHRLGVPVAKLYLSNRPAGGVNLPKNYRRAAHRASRRPAGTHVAASADLNRGRRVIEVGFEHRFPRD